jgi:antitoxin VapB
VALNIKNPKVEKLAAEVAKLTGETKTEAIRRALQDRKERLISETARDQMDSWRRFLETEVWPLLPEGGTSPSKAEREEILGYGPEGV